MNREGAKDAKEEKEGYAVLPSRTSRRKRFVQIIKKPYNFGVSKISCFDKIDRTSSNPISTSAKISPTLFPPPCRGGAPVPALSGGVHKLAETQTRHLTN